MNDESQQARPQGPEPSPALALSAAALPKALELQYPQFGEQIPWSGQVFTIGEHIGTGSFGTVYECTDEWNNQLAAKILLPRKRPYEEIKANWEEEIGKLLTLRHPNITFLHGAFEYKNGFYLIMERCFSTFSTILKVQDLKSDLWLPGIAKDVLQGLNYIHSAGFVHKDIHAGNIFVAHTYDNLVKGQDPVWSFKIGDLGICRLEANINVLNTILAKWMLPPEAIRPHDFGTIDKRVDIYHTGLLLLSLMEGKTLNFSEQEIIDGAPRQLAEKSASKFGLVVAKALRRHVEHRYATALEFWRELSPLIDA